MGWIKKRISKEHEKHKDLDWAEIAEKKLIAEIMDWCYKNNTIPLKNTRLRLCIADGGWINVMHLNRFLKEGLRDEKSKQED